MSRSSVPGCLEHVGRLGSFTRSSIRVAIQVSGITKLRKHFVEPPLRVLSVFERRAIREKRGTRDSVSVPIKSCYIAEVAEIFVMPGLGGSPSTWIISGSKIPAVSGISGVFWPA